MTAELGNPSPSTILVLEDDPVLVELIRIYLEDAGYTVLAAGDLDRGIELAGRHGSSIHLVLSDVFLPGAVAPKVAALFAALPVAPRFLYMSGRSRATIPPRNLLVQGADLLEKPFSEAQLIAKVRLALAGARAVPPSPCK
jgi:DNA-binding response OmpR family regulator